MSNSDVADNQPNSFRRPGFLLAAAFITLVLLIAVVLTLRGGNGTPETAPPPAPTASAATAASGNDCNLSDTNQTIPNTPPTGVTWSVFKTVAMPSSEAAGPRIVEGDVARCYAHTPVGALLAANQISVRHLLADDWRAVNRVQVMPGPGRDTFMKLRATVTDNTAQPGQYGQMTGFKFVTYTSQLAVIQVISRFANDGSLQVTTSTVTWSEGDWRLQLQPNGSDSPSAQKVSSLAGFVPWGGV